MTAGTGTTPGPPAQAAEVGGPRAGVGTAHHRGTVLHFIARWLPVSEGFVYDLVGHVDYRGIVVADRPLENTERFPHAELHSLGTLRRMLPGALAQRAATGALLWWATTGRADVVHAHHGYEVDHVLGLVRRRRVPFVLSLHGDDVTGLVTRDPAFYRRAVPLVSAVVVPSRFLVDHALAAGFRPEQVRVIPSGVDTELFSPAPLPSGDPEVLFVGRFVEKKGLDVLGAAWPSVQRAVPRARLRIFGVGPLESLARAIAGNVEVVLAPTRTMVRDAMRRARVVVSPSRTAAGDSVESLLVVNLEAQASGRPVVTTRHGGIPEYVRPGTTALVVPEGDAAALAEALVALVRDDALASRLAAAGPEWAGQFDLRRTAAQMASLYDELRGLAAP
ncbi:MAG TPA: glycosyltransferase [Acidimicrobiales bacterium]|nr:glycosyltransferase [Acidimicrobiales bacterium]